MKDVVVLGGLNMDLIVETPKLAGPGETLEGTRFYTTPGGKGGNQAVGAARLAESAGTVKMVSRVGDDSFGTEMIGFLENEGIDTSFTRITPNIASGIAAIFILPDGENTVNPVYGANALCDEQQVSDIRSIIDGAGVLLCQQEVPLDTTRSAMKIAREAGVPVVLDPAPFRDVPDGFYSDVSVLTPNQGEASLMSSIEVVDTLSAEKAARVIRKTGIDTVIVTLGGEGAWVESEGVSEYLPPHKVDVVASVAAGDAFNGGLGVGLASGMHLMGAARLGMASGALSTTKDGAQDSMPTRAEVDALLGI